MIQSAFVWLNMGKCTLFGAVMLYTTIYNDNMGFKFSHLIATCLQTLNVFAWIFPYRMAMPSNDATLNPMETFRSPELERKNFNAWYEYNNNKMITIIILFVNVQKWYFHIISTPLTYDAVIILHFTHVHRIFICCAPIQHIQNEIEFANEICQKEKHFLCSIFYRMKYFG